jgi:hypothetical protein
VRTHVASVSEVLYTFNSVQARVFIILYWYVHFVVPIPVAARSKAWVCGRSLAGIAGSNSAGSMNVFRECCEEEVSASG